MALQNEILTGRHNKFLQKLFGIKATAPAPQLSSEISVSQGIFHGVENRFLESWGKYGVGQLVPAGGAGTNSAVRLRNPALSGIIAVVEMIWVGATTAINYDIQFGQPGSADLTTVTPARAMDGRNGPQSSMVWSFGTPVGEPQIGTNIVQSVLNALVSIGHINGADQQIVLFPGDALEIACNTGNAALFASIWWRQRALEEGELK
jgi:hypothetical protein